jgi:predicted enzyme related to lactoylglutathione lyase
MSTFVHMELNTSDPKAAKQFYKAVFGWEYQDMPMPEGVYTMVPGIGGITQHPMPDAPSSWLGYVGVDSVERTVAKVEKAGGTVVMGRTEIPGMGYFAVFNDPQGAPFAIWEPAAPASTEQATEAPTSKKTSKKKSAGKKKSAAAEPPAEKKTSKKQGAKQAAKKAPKKAAKKAAKKTAKKAAKKK